MSTAGGLVLRGDEAVGGCEGAPEFVRLSVNTVAPKASIVYRDRL